MRRALLPAATALLVLTACGGEATYTGASEESGGSGEGGGSALSCEEPPEAPGDVTTYAQSDLPEPVPADPATLTATLETNCGDIGLELYAADAPQTVASFEFLAQEGYWEDSACHRLTTSGISVLQCGDPTGTGSGNPGYGYGIENAPEDGLYPPGTLAMARTQDPESNGGQFFIVYDDTQLPVEGGGYSIFGRVTSGLEIVEAVAEAGTASGGGDGAPAQPISLLSVNVDG
ncbi:putative peptidyl-prolyl cis-trans isomerase B (PPIase B) (Rotamase B) [Serinicoccus hydrothermalis]|uniref:Peptidyl-prolyl cis-trans isomerase n=1 Tax=Serinicoccus hydrothermalis TaxID=1758689 RepID=A0A1B1N8S2_9MICO|nr:peptidylprolyl isomerase [Serinicoccus hydrothermalis]ANS77830.1 putative peptidyl-prolyl cis-trans isomerase B (PPIase B) (Rotamase B) [Serinicoccus hydrothermalis]